MPIALLPAAPPKPHGHGLRTAALIPLLAMAVGAGQAAAEDPGALDIARTVSRGDIRRDRVVAPGTYQVPLYQGNGVLGSCVGPFGLHLSPSEERRYIDPASKADSARTVIMHKDHFLRGSSQLDYMLPALKVYWSDDIHDATDYRQIQRFHDGTVETEFSDGNGTVRMLSWADPVRLGSYVIKVSLVGAPRAITIQPMPVLTVHYQQHVTLPMETSVAAGEYRIRYHQQAADITFVVASDGRFSTTGDHGVLTLDPGEHVLSVRESHDPACAGDDSLAECRAYWRQRWQDLALISFPEEEAQQLWVRSIAYLLFSFSERSGGFMSPPGGLSGNMWPFPFPQDLSFIHPALLSCGRLDIVKTWIERYHSQIPGMEEYTRRTYGKQGILCPWVMPLGTVKDYLSPAPPNTMYYQVHNSGYLARMADETARATGDAEWTRRFAHPLIGECAAFYADMLTRGADGRWRMDIHPAMGQDERGGFNERQYLCALTSARYTLGLACARGLDPGDRYQAILRDGIAVETLLDPARGMLCASSSGPASFGRQKHPPQLNPLAFLPMGGGPTAELVTAYQQRDEITLDAPKPFFYGWTQGEFLVSAARMKDPQGWLRHWRQMGPAGKVDGERIQIYETSTGIESGGVRRGKGASYFITEHGLWAQALHETLISEWWGGLDLAPCFVWQGEVRFRRLRTVSGLEVSGRMEPGCYEVELLATRDATVRVRGADLTLRAGETRRLVSP